MFIFMSIYAFMRIKASPGSAVSNNENVYHGVFPFYLVGTLKYVSTRFYLFDFFSHAISAGDDDR